jgi:aspartyl-tRNA(Asn)/glutamyl-tRNA(Gln) amidotransferase subunit B
MLELPSVKKKRFIESYGLREYDAQVLTFSKELAAYYEEAARASSDAKATANWVMGDLLGALKAEGKEITESPIPPQRLGELVSLVASGELSGKLGKDVFAKMLSTGDGPRDIMQREGLQQISDTSQLEKIVDDVLAASPKQVEQYKSGKTTVIGYLVGQVMKASRGQANPGIVNELLRSKLG